jgi:hypothetical protein
MESGGAARRDPRAAAGEVSGLWQPLGSKARRASPITIKKMEQTTRSTTQHQQHDNKIKKQHNEHNEINKTNNQTNIKNKRSRAGHRHTLASIS